MQGGRLDEAARLWRQVLAAVPEHPRALLHLGQHTLLHNDANGALVLLERAARATPKAPEIELHISFAHRALGDVAAEIKALDRALAIDPRFFPAFLAKGMTLERIGKMRSATNIYKIALRLAPPEESVPKEMRERVAHAREVVERSTAEMDAFLTRGLQDICPSLSGAKLDRFQQCRDVAIGRKVVFTQQPNMLHFPGLPAVQFYDNAAFSWLKDLEAASEMIRDELVAVLREDSAGFRPYIQHGEGAAASQWAELNHSPRWSAFFLWKAGVRVHDHCRRCPRTAALLETLPLFDMPQFGPTVMFSALAERTRIQPHTGDTNVRLVGHLPLILPPHCRFRVGNETREWRVGEAWIFDDTIEHEALNDSDDLRVILIFDVWNPHVNETERKLVGALFDLIKQYNAD